MNNSNTIPPITDPMGKHWSQPSLEEILIDDNHALMTPSTFSRLSEYNTTNPSGVYPGKMWKRKTSSPNQRFYLMWYDACDDPKMCAILHRRILLVE